MKITDEISTSLAAVPILRAQFGPLKARFKIDTERVIGDIDPKIYGNFIEHLGRCIDGGIFEEHSPPIPTASQRRARRRPQPNVTMLRWPGKLLLQLSLDGWHRPPRPAPALPRDGLGHSSSNASAPTNSSPTPRMLKTEPYICCNLGTGT